MEKMCRVLKVSQSGYYQWLTYPGSATKREDQKIYDALKSSYEQNKGRSGLDKLLADVHILFLYCSRNRLYRIQKAHGLYSIRHRKFKVTANSRNNYPVAPNLLHQDFHADAPNKVWVTDITYVRTDEGWLYLAAVKDLFDRQIVGFATGSRIDTNLCMRALSTAIQRCKPGHGLTYHSDQGGQYASRDYQELLLQNRIVHSMSRKGVPYDNACAESFFQHDQTGNDLSRALYKIRQARNAIFEYIEVYYNRQRRNAAIGNIPPAEFRRRFYQRQAA